MLSNAANFNFALNLWQLHGHGIIKKIQISYVLQCHDNKTEYSNEVINDAIVGYGTARQTRAQGELSEVGRKQHQAQLAHRATMPSR